MKYALLLLFLTFPGPGTSASRSAVLEEDLRVEDESVRERGAIEVGGQRLGYEATTGTYVLRKEDGSAKARIFYVAYELDSGVEKGRRPITFCFNGGPGSSSVWLHLGIFGPRRVDWPESGEAPAPPYRLVDNEHTLLRHSDLVFIDPVTTGYSRALPGEDPAQFHGVEEDVEWVAEFIRLYTTREQRWGSPKLLAGESYGTTRAAALAGHLQQRHGMYLNGLVLVSSILSFQTVRFDVGNDLPYPLFLPTYAATAWYHKKLEPELQRDLRATLAEVEEFALGEYATALLRGDRLAGEERERTATRLARYTGLSREYVERSNLRVRIGRFCKELLRAERRTVGRLDSRFQGIDRDAAGESYEHDPSYTAIQGPFTGALNQYLREELGYQNDLTYEILTGRVQPWSYSAWQNRYLEVSETLRSAMTRNPALRVFVASGYYDLATPYFATRHTLDHLELDPGLRGNLVVEHYEAGHMMYIHRPSLEALAQDLARFYEPLLQPR